MQAVVNIVNKYTINICSERCISLVYVLNSCINIHCYSIFPLNFRGQTGVTAISQAKENSRKTKVFRDKNGTWVRNRCKAIQTCAPVKRMLLDQQLIESMYTLSLEIIVHIFSLNLSTTPKYLKPSYLSSL